MVRHPTSALGVRNFIRRLHLWLGLSLGLLFALLALSGSALVFYSGIDAALHPAVAAGPGDPPPALDSPAWDRALAAGRARWHHPGDKWTLEVTGSGGPIPARYYPAPGHGHSIERMMVWFSNDGARIVRAEPWGGYLMSWIYQFHMALLAGDLGGRIVGWSGLAMLLLLLTGMAAWWPRASWRKALSFKRNAVPVRRLRDLHKLSGLWSLPLLLLLVTTGVLLALPTVTQALFAPTAIPAPTSFGGGDREITVVQAFAAARRAIPDGRIVFVDMPGAGNEPIRVRLQVPGDPHRRFPGSYVFIDRFSGRILAVHDVRRVGTGSAVSSWVRALHDGTVGGLATRLLVVLAGFMPAFLFATGFARWWQRRRVRRF